MLFVLLSTACGGGGGGGSPGDGGHGTRSFFLGFTDFPHASSIEAVAAAFDVIARDGDMAVLHFDGGVPWQEALDGTPYPASVREDIAGKARAVPPGHGLYLAVTPIGFFRDELAPRWGERPGEPLEPPWDTRGFDHPSVIEAFRNHCERMIELLSPDFFAFAIEANVLADVAPDRWPAFVVLARSVYESLKARHPALPIFLTLEAEAFHRAPRAQRAAIAEVLPFTDLIAVSAYPFTEQPDPGRLQEDYFAALAALAPAKPFAIAETGWPAEDVTAPYPVFIPATESSQLAYVRRLLDDSDRLSARFVTWFFTRDYDDFWQSDLRSSPIASVARLWKDTGLYDGAGAPRPALAAWRRRLALPRAEP